MAGLVPAISFTRHNIASPKRDARHKAGRDKERYPIPFTIARATSATVALRLSAGVDVSVR
jgi:hypothetical protein